MRLRINDKKSSFTKLYFKRTRRILAVIREPVSELAGNTDPDRLRERVEYLLKPELMQAHIMELWGTVGGKAGYEMEKAINSAKSGKPDMEIKKDRLAYWNERSKMIAARKAAEKAKSIIDAELEAINTVIDMVVDKSKLDGLGIPETRSLLKDYLEGDEIISIERWQAERIARTEVIGASNTGSFEAAKGTDGLTKGWLTSGLPGVRPSHQAYESLGEKLPMDYSFAPGLSYPGDPGGDPSEIINCRCVIIYNVGD